MDCSVSKSEFEQSLLENADTQAHESNDYETCANKMMLANAFR